MLTANGQLHRVRVQSGDCARLTMRVHCPINPGSDFVEDHTISGIFKPTVLYAGFSELHMEHRTLLPYKLSYVYNVVYDLLGGERVNLHKYPTKGYGVKQSQPLLGEGSPLDFTGMFISSKATRALNTLFMEWYPLKELTLFT